MPIENTEISSNKEDFKMESNPEVQRNESTKRKFHEMNDSICENIDFNSHVAKQFKDNLDQITGNTEKIPIDLNDSRDISMFY